MALWNRGWFRWKFLTWELSLPLCVPLILLYSSLNLSVDDDDDIITAADDLIDLATCTRRCPLCFWLNDWVHRSVFNTRVPAARYLRGFSRDELKVFSATVHQGHSDMHVIPLGFMLGTTALWYPVHARYHIHYWEMIVFLQSLRLKDTSKTSH